MGDPRSASALRHKDFGTPEGSPLASPHLETIEHGPNAVTGILHSGKMGLGPQGEELKAEQHRRGSESTAYSFVEAQGRAPEMIATTSPTSEVPGSFTDDGEATQGSTLAASLANVLPSSVLGVDLTGLKGLAGGEDSAAQDGDHAGSMNGSASPAHDEPVKPAPTVKIDAPDDPRAVAVNADADLTDDDESGTPPLPFASEKENGKFHAIFPSLRADPLLSSYPCALQRDILVQGKLYLSSSHLCFKANIFGWRTLLILPLSEIVSIQKRTYAKMFQNALTVCTAHAKNVFASILHRDQAYEEIVTAWKVKHGRAITNTYRGRATTAAATENETANDEKQDDKAKKVQEHEGVRDDSMELASPVGSDSDSDSSDDETDDETDEDHRSPADLLVPPQGDDDSRPSSVRSAPSPLPSDGDPPKLADLAKAQPTSPDAPSPSDNGEGSSAISTLATSSSSKGGRKRAKSKSFRFGKLKKDETDTDDHHDGEDFDGLRRVSTGHGSLKKVMSLGLGRSKRQGKSGGEETTDDEGGQGGDAEEKNGKEEEEKATDAQAVADSYRKRMDSVKVKEEAGKGKKKKKGKEAKKAKKGKGEGETKVKAAHKATECPCSKTGEHFDAVAIDATYPTTPEKMFALMFTDHKFFASFMENDQKVTELHIGEWENVDEGDEALKKREMNYVKPLNASFGPKTTKCLLTEENINVDFDDYITTMTTTRTPDVPCGSNFEVKTRTCMTYVEGGGTRVLVTTGVEWSKVNRMLKGVIERSAIDGQKATHAALDRLIRKHIDEHPDEYLKTDSPVAKGPPATEGAGPTAAAAATAATSDVPGGTMGVLQGLTDTLGGPTTAALLVLVVVLLVSNWWTWRKMVHYRGATAEGMGREAEGMRWEVEALERRLGGLKERMEGLRR